MSKEQEIRALLEAMDQEDRKHARRASERFMATLRQRQQDQARELQAEEKDAESETPKPSKVSVEFTGIITPEQPTPVRRRRIFMADEPEQGTSEGIFTDSVKLPDGKDEWSIPPFPPSSDDEGDSWLEPRKQ